MTEHPRLDAILASVPDEGAAAVIQEALGAEGIAVVVRPIPYDPYRPALSGTPLELRVARGDLARAEQVLARLEAEVGEETDAQARATAHLAPTPADRPPRR